MTPEQIAAKRAAAMAMYGGGQPAAAAKPAAPKAAAPKPAEPPTESTAALDISDGAPAEQGKAESNPGGLVTALPSGSEWVKIVAVEPTPAMVKKAKKEGAVESVHGGCKQYNLKDVAYLFDEEGRTHSICWRTKLQTDFLTGGLADGGDQPLVRFLAGKKSVVVGKDEIMWNAIVAHSGATLTLLPTCHVLVAGSPAAGSVAKELIDDLLDSDGEATKKTLAARLVVAEPWGGVLEFPCPDDWVGAIIGKGGSGLKQIASESGALIDYIDPEEAAKEKGDTAEAEPAVDVSDAARESGGEGDDAKAARGYFRIRGKFENQCRLAAKRLEEKLALVQRLDVHGYVMVPRGVVGRLIGKGGTNIKLLQRQSGASRIAFDKEPGGRSTTQACMLQATDIETAIGAAKTILEAVPDPNASIEHKEVMNGRLVDWPKMVSVLRGGDRDAAPVADATREMAIEAHRAKFGTGVLASDQQTKDRPAELAAVDFDVWVWEWSVCQPLRA